MRIKLKYQDVDAFIERYSVNLSRGGVFIATRAPKPVGTVLRFEFQLASGEPVIRGEGQVVWVKAFDPDEPRRVHGMGVRFTRLDAESRALVDRALAWKREHIEAPRADGPPPDDSDEHTEEDAGSGPVAAAPAAVVLREPDAPLHDEFRETDPTSTGSAPALLAAAPEAQALAGAQAEATQLDELNAHEAVAELMQATHSQVVRAARHIVELTASQVYYPEDTELAELLRPVRISLPPTGRDAARLLGALLGPQRGD